MNKKSFVLLLLSLFVLGNFIPTSALAATATDTVTVMLHKRVWEDDLPKQQVNSGNQMDFGGQPLPGANFEVYDVTKRFYEDERQPGFSVKDYIENWSKRSLQELSKEQLGRPVAVKVTNEVGEITVTVPAKTDDKDAVYLFVETGGNTPKGYRLDQASIAPTLLVLPMFDKTKNQVMSTIHIYPKNVVIKNPVTPVLPVPPTKPQKPTNPLLPNTGEVKSRLAVLGGLIVILSGILVIVLKKRRKNK